MVPVGARLISRGSDGRTAEVVVHLGEGAQRRSVTRHVHFVRGAWVGRNPDEAAVERLDVVEAVECRAREAVKHCESALMSAEVDIVALKLKEEALSKEDYREASRELGERRQEAEAELTRARNTLEAVTRLADAVRVEVQREVQFIF